MLDAASMSSLSIAAFSGNLEIAQPQVNIADRHPDQHQAKGVLGIGRKAEIDPAPFGDSAMIERLMLSAMTNRYVSAKMLIATQNGSAPKITGAAALTCCINYPL